MKYWEKIKEPITKTETPWFVKVMWCVGFLIGIIAVGIFAGFGIPSAWIFLFSAVEFCCSSGVWCN